MFKKIILSLLAGCLALSCYASTKTINILLSEDKNLKAWMDFVKTEFTKNHPDFTVKYTPIIQRSYSDLETKLAFNLRSSEQFDIVCMDTKTLENFAAGKFIVPIPELKNWSGWKNFYESIIESVMYKDQYYGLPISMDTRGIYYNIEIFKKAGIPIPWQPKNWEDIYIAAKTIKEKVPEVWPFSCYVEANSERTTMQTLLMFLYGTNDRLYKNGKWVVTSKGLLDTFTFLDRLFKDKLTAPMPIMVGEPRETPMKTHMPKQRIAIRPDGCWLPSYWHNAPKTNEYYNFAAMPTQFGQKPGFVSPVGGQFMAIPANSKHIKDGMALEFMKTATTPESMKKMVEIQNNLAAIKDKNLEKVYPRILKKAAEFIPYAKFRPTNTNYAAVSNTLSTDFQYVVTGQKTPKEAMETFADNVQTDLGKDKIVRKL